MKQLKLLLFLIGVYMLSSDVSAQNDQEVFLLDRQTNPGMVLRETPEAIPRLEGSVYLFEEWQKSDAVLKNGKSIFGVFFNYDMLNEIFEFRTEEYIKKLDPAYFTEVNVYDQFLNTISAHYKVISKANPNLTGILKVIYQDSTLLIGERPYVEVKEPDYIPELHVGNPNKEILKKKSYYLVQDGQYTMFKRTKSSLSEISGKEKKEVKSFMKSQNIDLDSDDDLVSLIQFIL